MSELHPYGTESWEAAVKLIHRSNNILLICHVSPDGDAIGSLLGLGLGLRTLKKRSTLACDSTLPTKFSFLPSFDSIVNSVDSFLFDLVIGLDSSDLARLGDVYDAGRLAGVPLINVDHHITNLYYGDVNLVDPSAASTAELVLSLLDHLGVRLDQRTAADLSTPELARSHAALSKQGAGRVCAQSRSSVSEAAQLKSIATCLLTGIVTDTLGFRTSNVAPAVMKAAVQLMEAGASLSYVTHYAFHQRSLAELSLLAKGLIRLQAEEGLAWSEILLSDHPANNHPNSGDAGLVGMLVRTKEVHVAAVFTEKENNQTEISFRADPGFDVAQLALSLGGGGHPAAAGCTIEGALEAAKARVLPMLRAALEEQRRSHNLG
jgi:phosphoesterase RecJ-like protein